MAGIDKAAIAFSIAITAIGVGIAFAGDSIEYSSTILAPVISNPSNTSSEPSETETQPDPFADLADKVKEENVVMEEETMMVEESAEIQTLSVDIPEGTASPGCEESNACYSPADITVNAGDTVDWINVDTAAHTVTAGNPADGPSGVFDSSLVMASGDYSFTFEEAGNYDYFCMVHPWMVGSVTVN